MTNPAERSRSALQGPMRVANRMHLRATGLDDEAIDKPFVGVVHTHSEVSPCVMSLAPQAAAAKVGVEVAGATARECSTVSISDVWTMVHETGPQFSLISREVIADSVELVLQGQRYDAAVTLGACDKTVPGMLMALTRVNIPGVYVHGGAALRGWSKGEPINFYRVFGDMDRTLAGDMSEDELEALNRDAMVSVGTCPGLNTASTGAACAEVMGFSALGTASIPAVYSQRIALARKAGEHAVRLLMEGGPRPRDWVTRESLENAVTVVAAMRGSSNMLLHLPAIANEAGVRFELKDMIDILRRTPRITSLIPNGPHALIDLDRIGGLPVVFKALLDGGLLHPHTPTNDGRTLAEALADAPAPDGKIVRSCDDPFQPDSGLVVLQGNLAPDGCIVKTADIPVLVFEGPARVFDGDAAARKGIAAGEFSAGEVIIVRGEGPRGSPGMREMLDAPIPIRQRGMGRDVALVTDGRWPAGTGGLCVAHVSPEAHAGGPLALVENGDIVRIDAQQGTIDFKVLDEEIARRRANLPPPQFWSGGGVGEKYARVVGPTHLGAPTHSYR
ncbi:dihydroxy-acid dehydratase [Sphingobium subterraneum]|uniref:Dihydroxy-acid dehydratase n=1 Tax=Sphingobium subterraneum TaxID=627688 RepID=A0A841J326_9SPHN|nr:dihydroxy-acid dehydratase [Sphingobium subterraneum]MBB6123015.1 dihydroxy-acid dehydratase [Sphingobium subterraneum]